MKSLLLLILTLITGIAVGFTVEHKFFDRPGIIEKHTETVEIRYKPFFQREEINDEIHKKIAEGRVDDILDIFYGIVGNKSTTYLILNAALIYNIPISLLFAIISVESNFDLQSVNKYDGGYDYGLMQLNSKTFEKYSREDLLKPEQNLRLGCEHLIKLKKKYGTWGEAIIHYNGLYERGAGRYLVKVFQKEREYERIFNEKI